MVRHYLIYILALLAWVAVLPVEAKDFTVVIDAGHGGKDPGARGRIIQEKAINLGIALKLGKLIEANHPDVRVVYTRSSDKFVPLDDRAEIANRCKADLFISIHTNSVAKGNSVQGTETYTLGLARTDENLAVAMRENSVILLEEDYQQRYEGFDPNSSESYIIFEFIQNRHIEQSISLASDIQRCFSDAKREDRGVRQAGFLVLRKTSMPSVLIEVGFISNQAEERYLASAEGQQRLAKAISDAFDCYKHTFDTRQAASGVAPSAQPAVTPQNSGKELPPAGSEADILMRKQQRLQKQKQGNSNVK